MKRSLFYRVLAFLYLFVVGSAITNTASAADPIKLDFSQEAYSLRVLSNKSDKPSTGTFTIGGYTFDVVNCSQQDGNKLVVAGNGEEGSVTFHPSLNLTSIKFTTTEVQSSCKMTVTCGENTLISGEKPIKGENTVSISTEIKTAGKPFTFTFSGKTKISIVTFVPDGTTPSTPTQTDWVKFKKYNDNSDLSDITELPAGQVIKLESLVQGLTTNSAIGSDYVITYSIDGNDPTFSGKQGGSTTNKYWKDGEDTKGKGFIYRRGIALTGQVGSTIKVIVKIFKITYDENGNFASETEAYTTNKTFTLTASTQPASSDITFGPTTTGKISNKKDNYDYLDQDNIEILDITESCTASGINGNTVIAKYSTNTTYDIQQILNAANVSMGSTTVGVFSTEYKMRKTSAIQITPDGIISNEVAKAYYWYIPVRKNLTLELVPSYSALSLSKDGIKETTVTMTAYYIENGQRTKVNLETLKPITIQSNDASIATTDGIYTLADDKLSATFVIKAADNGTTKINVQTSKTSAINVKTYNNGQNDETAINYNIALSDVTVKVIDGSSIAPPTITPESSDYHIAFKSNVQADANYPAYYWVVKGEQTASPTITEIQKQGNYIVKGQKVETDIEAGEGNIYNVYAVSYDEATKTLGTRIAHSTYNYVKIENPVLTPGNEGEENYYGFDTNELTIIASVATPGAQVYYTINSANDDVTKDNGILYDGTKKIVIDRSSRIRAVAYKNGIYSDVVLYRYNKNTIDIDSPQYYIDGSEERNEAYTKYDNIGNKPVVIRASYTDSNGDSQTIDETSPKFSIYYTTDGSLPTPESYKYKGAFTVDGSVKQIISYVLADGEGGDYSMSDRSILTLENQYYHVWQTKKLADGETPDSRDGAGNCDKNGVLKVDHAELYASTDSKDELEVKAYFGGFASATDIRDNKQQWDHYTSKEVAKGTPIDGIGDFSVAPNIDAKDEMGLLYNHGKANTNEADYQTHKSTFKLPSMGAYTKFEPQKDGDLTIYCFQEGALYYRDAIGTKDCFNSRFLRKRPVYFVDEAGISIKPTSIETSGFLSKKWYELENNNFAGSDLEGEGKMQNGISQTLYTQQETLDIYNMFNGVIISKSSNSTSQDIPLKDLVVYLNDGTHNNIAGYGLNNAKGNDEDKVNDGTGICLPTASYMKYTFPVEAGKTYFFFGWMTKLGIRGFGFEPDTTQPTGVLDIKASKTENNTFENGKKYATAKLERTFEAGKWTTLVLPFSVSASEVKNVFGDDTQILHYRTIQGRTMYFFKHYHQMIVAGTPVLIKPSKAVENPTFKHIKIEAATVTDEPCNDYGYKDEAEDTQYKMVASYDPLTLKKGNYFLAKNGTVKLWTGIDTKMSGTTAYMTGSSSTATLSMAKASFDNLNPESMDGNVTGIDFIESDATSVDGNIYNVNGQLVRKDAKNTNGLSKGIYIVNGKKVIIK